MESKIEPRTGLPLEQRVERLLEVRGLIYVWANRATQWCGVMEAVLRDGIYTINTSSDFYVGCIFGNSKVFSMLRPWLKISPTQLDKLLKYQETHNV